MPPRSTKAPIPQDAHRGDRTEFPYGINARLGEPQAQYLNAVRRDQGIGTSAAVRYAIDRAIEREESAVSINDVSEIPELARPVAWDLEPIGVGDQVQLVIDFEQDDEPGTGHRVALPMDRAQAHLLLDHLDDRLAEADRLAAGTDA